MAQLALRSCRSIVAARRCDSAFSGWQGGSEDDGCNGRYGYWLHGFFLGVSWDFMLEPWYNQLRYVWDCLNMEYITVDSQTCHTKVATMMSNQWMEWGTRFSGKSICQWNPLPLFDKTICYELSSNTFWWSNMAGWEIPKQNGHLLCQNNLWQIIERNRFFPLPS